MKYVVVDDNNLKVGVVAYKMIMPECGGLVFTNINEVITVAFNKDCWKSVQQLNEGDE